MVKNYMQLGGHVGMVDSSFEKLSADFVSCTARALPDHLRSLTFASPLSARSPDLCMLWHDGYRERHKLKLLINLIISNIISIAKGCIRLMSNFRPFGYGLYGKINDRILVVTSTCGSENYNGGYETPYVSTGQNDGLFVFGPIKDCGKDAKKIKQLPVINKLLLTYALMKSGTHAFLKIKGNITDRFLVLLQWYSWALCLHWLSDYYFEKTLSEVVKQYSIKKIGCIHEMHFYSRIVWRVASKYNAVGYTVQHAVITSGKRWYFPYREEKEAGLKFPDVMHVYNEKVVELFKPYYEKTLFVKGCSYRYSQWKDLKEIKSDKGRYYLFAGALAGFDNEVLIASLRKLVHITKGSLPIRLRLHPYAKISFTDRRWLRTNAENSIISISKDVSLKTDIENAFAVIGMSTTVLEEALLMGRPVIQLTHPDYLQYIDIDGIRGVTKKDFRELSVKDLLNVSNIDVNSEGMRERLGIDQPIVTYERLFEMDVNR